MHDGMVLSYEGLLFEQSEPVPIPSRIRYLALEEQILIGIVPVIQLLDNTNVFSRGKSKSLSGSVPWRLIVESMT
jgi:hypothetical protein